MPPSLALETSWATTSITSFIRSALTFQVRKRVADVLREHLPDADDFLPPPISKPPRLHLIKVEGAIWKETSSLRWGDPLVACVLFVSVVRPPFIFI